MCVKIFKSENFNYENLFYVIKNVEVFVFIDDCSVFFYFFIDKLLCFLFFYSGNIFFSVLGLNLLYFMFEGCFGYCFCIGDKEKNVFVRDFLRDFIESVWVILIYIGCLEIVFFFIDII